LKNSRRRALVDGLRVAAKIDLGSVKIDADKAFLTQGITFKQQPPARRLQGPSGIGSDMRG
jgi:hypothetical protein